MASIMLGEHGDQAPQGEAPLAAEPRPSLELFVGEVRQEGQGFRAASLETLQGAVEVLRDVVALGRYHVAGKIGQIGLALLHASTDAKLHALGLEVAQMADMLHQGKAACRRRPRPPIGGNSACELLQLLGQATEGFDGLSIERHDSLQRPAAIYWSLCPLAIL